MKVTPMPSTGIPVGNDAGVSAPSRVEAMRSITMRTNANPTEYNQQDPNNLGTTPTAAVEDTKPISPQLAFLAKQKRALQIKERQIRERERALMTQPTAQTVDAIDRARLQTDPLGVLLESGVTYDQLTQAILNNPNQGNSEIFALKAKIEALEKDIPKSFEEKLNEREKKAEQQALSQMRREADSLMRDDKFELVRETRSVPTVMALIERNYRKTGEVLSVPEALSLVEEELFKDYSRMNKLKKFQIQQQQLSQTAQPKTRTPYQQMRTLTNRDTAQAPLGRRARALAAFSGELRR